jgi:hypothetical protein
VQGNFAIKFLDGIIFVADLPTLKAAPFGNYKRCMSWMKRIPLGFIFKSIGEDVDGELYANTVLQVR